MLELDKIHCGDNCDLLGQLPRECIDLVVTSPPIDDEEELEPEPEIDSNGFFCRFTPWQIDKMASHLLGEKPLCEKWISRDEALKELS